MSTTTTNYSLVKPAPTDVVDIAVLNSDLDVIDARIFAKVDKGSLVYNVKDYGAVANSNSTVGNGTDDHAAFVAALTAAGAGGGVVYVPPGKYRLSAPITVGKGQTLMGAGGGWPADTTTASTLLVFDNNVNGVILAGQSSELAGVMLRGGTGAVNGVTVAHSFTRCVDVGVLGFGQDGVNLDSTVAAFADCFYAQNVKVRSCGRDGFHLIGSDSNACVFLQCSLVDNGRAGIWSGPGASRNSYYSMHLDSNAVDGIVDAGISNMYDAYIENGAGGTLNVATGSSWGIFRGTYYAFPTVTGDANALSSWNISNGLIQRGKYIIGDRAGDPAGIAWSLNSGNYGTGWFSIRDENSAAHLVRALLGSAAYWYVHQLPNATGTYDIGSSALKWRDLYLSGMLHTPTYTTTGRPSASTAGAGACYYDTTVSKPVWSDGSAWKDAVGTAV